MKSPAALKLAAHKKDSSLLLIAGFISIRCRYNHGSAL
jgi:hypothetical protein